MNTELEKTAHWEANPQSVRPSSVRRAWLTVLTGTEAGRVYPLKVGVITIGRQGEAQVVLVDKQVSRTHTGIEVREDGTALVWDCGSHNGTLLGHRSLDSTPCPLRDGAKLQIGGAVVLRFSFRDDMEEHFERKLYDSATRDGLTGAFNKRYLADRLRQEFQHAERYDRPIAMVLFDLDNFKAVNDTHGHAAGDEVLRQTVKRLTEGLRDDEILARYGGEEFVVLMHKANLPAGLMLAERMRRLVCREGVAWEDTAIQVSASFGVASSAGGWCKSPEHLFRSADKSLYRAKRAGKNRVCGMSNKNRLG